MADLTVTMDIQEDSLIDRLKELSEANIREVDPKELVDISTVKISPNLSAPERMKQYVEQIKNPYCYLSHGVVVKISFAGSKTLEECIKDCISAES